MSKDESDNDEDLDLEALLQKLEENDQKEDDLQLEKRSRVLKSVPKTSTAEALLGALETLEVSEAELDELDKDNSKGAVRSTEIVDSMDELDEERDPFPPGIVHAIRVIQTEFDLFESDELEWED
ncbi:MAG: hypothetical protein ACFFCZ_26975 [Promethearchaeota archaeon]